LKKGLDDPALTKAQKDELRKVLGETEDIIHLNKGEALSVYVNTPLPQVKTSKISCAIARLHRVM